MKSFRRLAGTIFLSLLMAVAVGMVLFTTSACNPEETGMTLEGVYYVEADDTEYSVGFDGTSFTFSVAGESCTGTYKYDGNTITLKLSDDESIDAKIENGKLVFTYKGVTYELLEKVEYTVTYELNGGEGTASAKVINGKTLAKPSNPTKDGFIFIAWYSDSSFNTRYTFDTPVTGNMTLYAQFVEDPGTDGFVVSFETGDLYTGEPIADMQTVGGTIYILPELPALNGKEFLGWWKSDSQDASKLTAKVEEGQTIAENTTLYAVWQSDAPAVSVTAEGVNWLSMGVNVSYSVTITAPDGSSTSVNETINTGLSQAFDFASAQAGEYTVSVTANGATTTAYYTNKALARVSLFEVDGSNLIFNEVDNASYYLISYVCGTTGHVHDAIQLDTNAYDFSDCDMIPQGLSFVVQAVADGFVTSASNPFVFERHLDALTGLTVNDQTDTLTWDATQNATSYSVTIETEAGKQTFTVEGTSFDLQQYYGALSLSVYPIAHGYNSSAAVTFTYDKARLSTPINIRAYRNAILWNAVEGATGYVVTIGDASYTVEENSFTPEDLSGVGTEFTVSVQAIAASEANNSFTAQAIISRELTNLAYKNGQISWSPVFGATKYGVRINGGEEFFVEDATSYAIELAQRGQNELSVRYYIEEDVYSWISITVNADVTVTLNQNTGSGAVVTEKYYASNDRILLPETLDRIGYTFNGWFTSATGGQKVESGAVSATADVTYFAQWQANTYKVTLVVPAAEGYFENGAEKVYQQEVEVVFGSAFTFPVPVSSNGTRAFYGWYTDFGGTGTQYTDPDGASLEGGVWNLASDRTFHPSWVEAFTYTLIADPLDASKQAYSISQGPGINYLKKVTVPAMYNGLAVARIEGSCFAQCSKLEEIRIPDSIVSVFTGDGGATSTGSAFFGCSSLQNIVIYDASSSISGNYQKVYSSIDGVLIYDNPYGGIELAYIPIAKSGEYTIPDVVTDIPLRAFYGTNITIVNVPATVTSIGERAFYSSKLVQVNFLPVPEGETAQPLVIGEEAFYFSNIEEITLPARLASFDPNIFTYCDELERVHIEEGGEGTSTFTSVDGVIFTDNGATLYYCPIGRSGSYTIPANVTSIGDRAFYRCTNLREVVIPGNVVSIGTEAFYGCTSLRTADFRGISSDPALTINESAFYGCSMLTTLSLPENLKVLKQYAFGNIAGLTSVTVNTTIEEIEYSNGAFASTSGVTYVRTLVLGPNVVVFDINGVFGSSNLMNVEVDPTNPYYYAVDGVLFNKDQTRIVYYPNGRTGAYVLPDTVEEIGANVFYGNLGLTSITFGPKITLIDASAFENCEKLATIVFTAGDTAGGTLTIGAKAFYHSGAVSVTLPEGKEEITIGDEAFTNCSDLENIVLPEGVVSIGHAAFDGCHAMTQINLPASLESLATYSTNYDYSYEIRSFEAATVAEEGGTGIDVFNYCVLLKTINVAEGNANYTVIDGVLYGKNAETGAAEILYFSPLKNAGTQGVVTVPATVKEIKSRAFYYNSEIVKVAFADRDASTPLTVEAKVFSGTEALEEVLLPSGLTEIPDMMFSKASIRSIFIPKTVTYIGEGAFYSCTKLEEVVFEQGGTGSLVLADGSSTSSGTGGDMETYYYGAFAGCTNLAHIELPERTTQIGNYAFYRAYTSHSTSSVKGLVSAVVPSTVERIGLRAFSSTTLESVVFKEGTAPLVIENYAFAGALFTELALSANVQSIGEYAFQQNKLLTKIYIPVGLKTIGESAFSQNTVLESVVIAEGSLLETIGEYAFGSNSQLSSVNLENATSLTTIGDSAFRNTALTKVQIPASVVTIGTYAFGECESLASIEFLTATEQGGSGKSNLETIGNYAFSESCITQIAFPESTSNIELGDYLFSSCALLTTVHLSTSVVDLGSALTGCSTIETITVADGNANYKVDDAQPLLLNVDGTTIVLVFGPIGQNGGEFVLPNGLTAIGESAFAGQNGIKRLFIPASVTIIGANAFDSCRSLETIEFEEGSLLTEIGANAFQNCYSLKSISLPEGLTKMGANAFKNTSSLKEAHLPSTLKSVGNYAFENSSSLETVNIPAIVSSSGFTANYMFEDCISLKNVTFSEQITWLSQNMFDGCTSLKNVVFPEEIKKLTSANKSFQDSGVETVDLGGITEIPTYMFYDAPSLATIDLNGVTKVGAYAFQNCAMLASVDLSSVNEIGNYAFSGCSSITEVDVSNSNSLGTYVFQNNTSLRHVTLSDALTSIGNNAFKGCTSLTTVDVRDLVGGTGTQNAEGVVSLPSALITLGNYAFQETAIREVTIPRGVTKLYYSTSSSVTASSSSHVFRDCKQLEKVILHDALQIIGGYSFTNCSNLYTVQYINEQGQLVGNEGEVTLPESLTILGNYAFGSGRGTGSSFDEGEAGNRITKATIPSSVEMMGQYAFQDCTYLTEAHYLTSASRNTTSATSYSTYVFDGCTSLERVVLNNDVASFGNNFFRNCSSLSTIDIYDPDTEEITQSEDGVATLPQALSYIGYGVFQNTAIREISIPRALIKLSSAVTSNTSSSSVFMDSTKLEKVILHDALQMIGEETFMNCTALKTIQYSTADGTIVGEEGAVTLPNSLSLIGDSAFAYSAIEKVVVPEGLAKVGCYLFRGCESLKEAQYLTSSTLYGTRATNYSTYMFENCTALEKVVLNSGITFLPEAFFSGCSSLKTIQLYNAADKATVGNDGEVLLPTALAEIGLDVFRNCSGMTNVILPSSLTEIGGNAFGGAAGLAALELPEGLTSIGDNVFMNTSLESITIPSTVTDIGDNAFGGSKVLVASGNTNYFSMDGVLLSASGTIVSIPKGYVADGASLTLPQEVGKVGSYALNGVNIAQITLSTDQISSYSFSGFTGDVVVTLGQSKELPARAFQDYAGTSVILPEGVEEFGDYLFMDAANLKTIDIPSTVRIFGRQIFRNCSSLVEAVVPEGVEELGDYGYTFNSCSSLVSVTLPSTLKELGNYEFANCTSLTSIVLPENLETFGNSLFASCTSLKEVTILSFTKSKSFSSSSRPFNGCTSLEKVILGENVTRIPAYLFYEADYLKEVVLPEGIENIGNYAFRYAGIESIVLPSTLTSVGTYVFADCASLKEVYIPEDMTSLSNYMFSNSTSLRNIFSYHRNEAGDMIYYRVSEGIADLSSITSIGTNVFDNATSITGVMFSNKLESIGKEAFRASGLKKVTVPGSVALLSNNTFQNCTSLEQVVLEEGVTEIGVSAFNGCSSLASITLPEESLVEIGTNAFTGCVSVKELVVPLSVSTISVNPFSGWTANQKIVFYIRALDASTSWNVSMMIGCLATIEIIPVFD